MPRLPLVLLQLITVLLAFDVAANCPDPDDDISVIGSDFVRVVSLNVAHGRKDGRNQILLKEETIRTNLLELAGLLDRADADVVALQEADGVSSWSGKFDHVAFLSGNSIYDCFFHSIHASNRIYDFGTALLSKSPFQGSFAHSFKPSKPTTTKGFSVAALPWNPGGMLNEPILVKFVSVHLDFSRKSVRRSQIDEMVRVLKGINGPMIIMGDFNTDWQTEDSSLQYLAEQMNLSVFEPHADGFSTYGDKGARLDWILVTPDLEFRKYAVFPDVVSDHYAVAAEIVLRDQPVSPGRLE